MSRPSDCFSKAPVTRNRSSDHVHITSSIHLRPLCTTYRALFAFSLITTPVTVHLSIQLFLRLPRPSIPFSPLPWHSSASNSSPSSSPRPRTSTSFPSSLTTRYPPFTRYIPIRTIGRRFPDIRPPRRTWRSRATSVPTSVPRVPRRVGPILYPIEQAPRRHDCRIEWIPW